MCRAFALTIRLSGNASNQVIHARSGVPYEIMGLMQGKVVGTSFVVMDSFAIPVQGTETRVNAAEGANEFMVEYISSSEKVRTGTVSRSSIFYETHFDSSGGPEGKRSWLVSFSSGLCMLVIWHRREYTNHKSEVPGPVCRCCCACFIRHRVSDLIFLPLQIDPNRTISAGKVDIGAFRTYPEKYTPPNSGSSDEYQSIPLSKIEDFGVHANQYYSLEVEVFKSELDDELLGMLWNKYWVNTLSQSPLISVSFSRICI